LLRNQDLTVEQSAPKFCNLPLQAGLPDGKFGKHCPKSVFHQICQLWICTPKCFHFMKYQLSALTKQTILDYLSNIHLSI